jgi:hypothetical protein
VLAATLASALPRVALFRFNDPRADGLLALNDELLPTGQVAVGMPGAAGGDIIIDDEVWPWAPGEYLEEVFESEGIEVGVVDHRGRRVRRTKLPLVLREGWRLLVVSPLTGAALVYTLMRDSPYGIHSACARACVVRVRVRVVPTRHLVQELAGIRQSSLGRRSWCASFRSSRCALSALSPSCRNPGSASPRTTGTASRVVTSLPVPFPLMRPR